MSALRYCLPSKPRTLRCEAVCYAQRSAKHLHSCNRTSNPYSSLVSCIYYPSNLGESSAIVRLPLKTKKEASGPCSNTIPLSLCCHTRPFTGSQQSYTVLTSRKPYIKLILPSARTRGLQGLTLLHRNQHHLLLSSSIALLESVKQTRACNRRTLRPVFGSSTPGKSASNCIDTCPSNH